MPHCITCNPTIADSYARAVLAWLRDCLAGGQIDADEPVHIVEVGAGSGRFAFHLLQRLDELQPASRLDGLLVRVVVSDFETSKLEALRDHPLLKDYLSSGRVVLAEFDESNPRDLGLGNSNPMVLVANYVFDSIPCDAFGVKGGRFQEALVSVSATAEGASLSEPDDLDALDLSWDLVDGNAEAAVTDPDLRSP